VVLVPGYVEALPDGRHRAGGAVVLITGDPWVIVDTGAPEQRQNILDALTVQGVDPADVQYVVNTHGHLDHIGNNNLFPRATFLLDTDIARDGQYRTHDFARPFEIPSIDGPPIMIVATPGHTDHDLSVLVETHGGVTAVVGDLFEYEGDETDGAWRAWSRNPVQQQASRAAICGLAKCIVPGHGGAFTVKRGVES
jgi:glyoxylase-like metal-dependent hydrolase (beta-lactamase superfamily II)